jgi:hypothetical protein
MQSIFLFSFDKHLSDADDAKLRVLRGAAAAEVERRVLCRAARADVERREL